MATTVWKGHLTFGLVSIPVRLFKAARPEKISFHQLRKAQPARAIAAAEETYHEPEPDPEPEAYTRVRQRLVAPAPVPASANGQVADAPVPRSEVVKGYEYEKNRYVVIDEEDLKQFVPKTATEMEILEFVRLAEIDPVFFETSYYLAPDEAGEKAYALLFEAMRQAGYVALAEVAMRRREHVMVIRPGQRGLIAHTMFYADEIRADQEYRADTSLVQPKEMQLATQLVGSLATSFEPSKFKDKFREKLQELIDARVAGRQVAEAPAPRQTAEVVDIMDALRNSLKAVKKPAASEPVAAKPRPKRATSR